MANQEYIFSVYAPINFYFGGKWYRYRPGDIFREDAERAERLLEAISFETRRAFRVTRPLEPDEDTSSTTVETLNEENQNNQEVDQNANEGVSRESRVDEERPESEGSEGSDGSAEEESSGSGVRSQQEPVTIEGTMEEIDRQDQEEAEQAEEKDRTEELSLDDHWATVNSALNKELENEDTDWDRVRWICSNFSQYKAVKNTCKDLDL